MFIEVLFRFVIVDAVFCQPVFKAVFVVVIHRVKLSVMRADRIGEKLTHFIVNAVGHLENISDRRKCVVNFAAPKRVVGLYVVEELFCRLA